MRRSIHSRPPRANLVWNIMSSTGDAMLRWFWRPDDRVATLLFTPFTHLRSIYLLNFFVRVSGGNSTGMSNRLDIGPLAIVQAFQFELINLSNEIEIVWTFPPPHDLVRLELLGCRFNSVWKWQLAVDSATSEFEREIENCLHVASRKRCYRPDVECSSCLNHRTLLMEEYHHHRATPVVDVARAVDKDDGEKFPNISTAIFI